MHIDLWTLGLQACNLLVLLALLRWLFYRPLLAVIEARRLGLQQQREQAEAALQQARAETEALARQREQAEQEHAQWRLAAHQQAEQEGAAQLEAARVAARQCLQEAQARIARERRQAGTALQQEAAALAVELAQRLLSHTPVADEVFWPALRQQLQASPAEQRAHWWPAEAALPSLCVCSARPLDEAARARLATDLRELLGPALTLSFETDPALIAGLELRFAHGVLGLSWAAELRAAEALLGEAEGPAAAAAAVGAAPPAPEPGA